MHKTRLFTPGPTPVPEFVQKAMNEALNLHHRHEKFRALFRSVSEKLPRIWNVRGPVVMLTGSGTAGMDAAVSNLFRPGDKVIVGSIGKFGERWMEICKRWGLQVVNVEKPWGQALSGSDLEQALKKHPDSQGVLIQACETSTGVENPLHDLASVIKDSHALWIVDTITGLGSMNIEFEKLGIDVALGASQKVWMLPPGLAFVWLSERAWKKAENLPGRPYYLDLVAHRDSQNAGESRFTPSIPMIAGLHAVLVYMSEQGNLTSLVSNAQTLARLTRKHIIQLGFTLFPKEFPASALTAVRVPEGWDGTEWVKFLRDRYGVTLAGGQGPLKGRIFRVNHLGYIDIQDMAGFLHILEEAKDHFTCL